MKKISLIEIKEKLGIIYNNCDTLEKYHIDTTLIKNEINSLSTLCDEISENNVLTSTNVQTLGDTKDLYDKFLQLESTVNSYLKAIHIFESIKSYNDNLSKEELNKLLETILNDLMNYERSTIGIEEFDELYPTFYKLIKMEFKYNGYSHILNYIRNSKLDEYKIDDLFLLDYKKYFKYIDPYRMINNMVLQDYTLYDKALLIISLNESGYLDKIKDELDPYLNKFEYLNEKSNELSENIKAQEKTNKKNKREKLLLQRTIIPAILSLTVFITANILASPRINEKTTSYKQTTEVYDTLNGNDTEITYGNEPVGDTTITIYNDAHNNGARVIKTYEFNDSDFDITKIEDVDYESMDFTSSEYKYDEDANNESLESFKVGKQIVDVDYQDIKENSLIRFALHLLISLPIALIDVIIGTIGTDAYYYDSKGPRSIFSLLVGLRHYLDYINRETYEINRKYIYENVKGRKSELKKLKKELDSLNKEYSLAYEKYQYLEEILKNYGYNKQLKRSK